MPYHIQFIGKYVNGLLAAIFAIATIGGFARGPYVMAVFCAGVVLLLVFNAYTIGKAAKLLGEEAFLESELRKAKLRREIAEYEVESEAPPGPTGLQR
jgi:hypothetical protein